MVENLDLASRLGTGILRLMAAQRLLGRGCPTITVKVEADGILLIDVYGGEMRYVPRKVTEGPSAVA